MMARKKFGKKTAKLKSKKLGNNRALNKVFSVRSSTPPRMSAES